MPTQDFLIFQEWAQAFTSRGYPTSVTYGDSPDTPEIEEQVAAFGFYQLISGFQTFPETGRLAEITTNLIVDGRFLMSVIGRKQDQLSGADGAYFVVEQLQNWLDDVYNLTTTIDTINTTDTRLGRRMPRPYQYEQLAVYEFGPVEPLAAEVQPYGSSFYIASQLVNFSATTRVSA